MLLSFWDYLKRRHLENIRNNIKIIEKGHWGLSGVSIRNKILSYQK